MGPSIPPIRKYHIDVEEQTAILELADGVAFQVPFPPHFSSTDAGLKRATFDAELGEFTATLPTGDEFLACAAGYANVVVGEKKISEYLKRIAPKVVGGAFVSRRLLEAIEHLQRKGEGKERV